MDLREVSDVCINRHPWEISRTEKIIEVCKKTFHDLHQEANLVIANIGAGDTYFDQCYLNQFPKDLVYAVDIGYKDFHSVSNNIIKVNSLEEVPEETTLDVILMMDSLEYMTDDKVYLENAMKRLKSGGKIILTLPAYQYLFSDHDIHVENLRRYDASSVKKLIQKLPSMHLIYYHYFYFSLFCVRFLEKGLRIPIDKEKKITTGWKHPEHSIVTGIFKSFLNLDYWFGDKLRYLNLFLPGLSMVVVCEKK